MRKSATLFLSALMLASLHAVAPAGIIDGSRTIEWSKAGVKGGIPNRPIGRNCRTQDGAVGDGVADDTAAIRACVSNAPTGTAAFLPAGTYMITGSIAIPSNKTLRGAGPYDTQIRFTGSVGGLTSGVISASTDYLNPLFCPSGAFNVVGSPAKGATTITLSGTSGLGAGSVVVISRLNGAAGNFDGGTSIEPTDCGYCGMCDGTRAMTQLTEVQSVNGNVITIDPPLAHAYDAAYSPQITPLTSGGKMTSGVGVENLYINNQSAGFSGVSALVRFEFVKDSWVKNVETQNGWVRHVLLYATLRATVRDSFFHTESFAASANGTPSHNYGVSVNNTSSFNLIENNRFDYVLVGVAMDGGPGSGNVMGYNYVNRQFYQDDAFLQASMASHSAHTTYNLYEGNQMRKYMSDGIHGSSAYTLLFRNELAGNRDYPEKTDGLWIGLLEGASVLESWVGDVSGYPGMSGTYERIYPADPCDVAPDTHSVFRIGYTNINGCTSGNPLTASTLYRHGNFDYVTGTTRWDAGNPDQSIPSSMYLTAKPAWWCAETPWPPIGPDLNPMVSDIPAKRQYDGRTCTTGSSGGGGKKPMPPYNLFVK